MLHSLKRSAGPVETGAPADHLLGCHARIRHFVGVATRLKDLDLQQASLADVADAVSGLRRYFSVALPLHEADEESDVTPLLLSSASRPAVEDHLIMMANEHCMVHRILDELDPLWAKLEAEPGALAALRTALQVPTRRLEAITDVHLAREERHVFPLVAALPPAEQEAIVLEMRRRRAGALPS
jgi:hypothetical protein